MWRMRRELLIPSDAQTLLSDSMGGAYVYVGKSRLRRKFRLKRQENKLCRPKSPKLSSNGSIASDQFAYDALPVIHTEVEVVTPELDTISVESFGTSGSSSADEEAIPLIELRPHSGSFSKMPFGPLKKMQEKKEAEEAAKRAAEEEEIRKAAELEEQARLAEEKLAEEKRQEEERLRAEEEARLEAEKNASNGSPGKMGVDEDKNTKGMLCCTVM